MKLLKNTKLHKILLILLIPILFWFGSKSSFISEENTDELQEPAVSTIPIINVYDNSQDPHHFNLADGSVFFEIRFLRTMLLTPNGDLWGWGDNISGALGDSSMIDRFAPVLIMQNVAHMSGSNSHAIAVTTDGRLYSWGTNRVGQLGIGVYNNIVPRVDTPTFVMDNIRWAKTSDEYTIAITTDNYLYTWGYNPHGQLGDGTTTVRNSPTRIMGDVYRAKAYRVTAHDGIFGHATFAIDTNNNLWGWGFNEYGHLGLGTYENIYEPIIIKQGVIQIFPVQEDRVVTSWIRALTEDYGLYSWGVNSWGQVGDGTTIDRSIPFRMLENVRFADERSAITHDNYLYTWGRNDFGQLGDGTFEHRPYPLRIMSNIAYTNNRGAITTDNILYVWGHNHLGQLGDTTTENNPNPIRFMENIHYVGSGFNRTFAVTNDGSLWVWGNGPLGQLGTGQPEIVTSPRRIFLNPYFDQNSIDIVEGVPWLH